MGKIYDKFCDLVYKNEDEVKQNFIIPLFTEFLGYKNDEIIPEINFPAKDIHVGVYKKGDTKGLINKPDYIFCIDGDLNNPKIVLDAKSAKENIDDHLPQIKSYTLSVGINLIVITNGIQLKVLNSNDLLFVSENIEELDLRFEELYKILSRHSQISMSLQEILVSIDEKIALGLSEEDISNSEERKVQLSISDYNDYLIVLKGRFNCWQIPNNFEGLNNIELKGIDPTFIHSFKIFNIAENITENDVLNYSKLELEYNSNLRVFIGETGIGKTSFLKYLTHEQVNKCLEFVSDVIPVFISLRGINYNKSLMDIISQEFQFNGIKVDSIIDLFRRRKFIFFLDGYDEVEHYHLNGLNDEIRFLAENNKVILTSRERSIPNIKPSDLLAFEKLNEDSVEFICQEYLGEETKGFLNEVINKGLTKESRNTLLLLFMISIYKEEGELPKSLNSITVKVVKRVENWDSVRDTSPSNILKWEEKELLLSELAFALIDQDTVSLSKDEIEKVILPIINDLVERRVISNGTTKDEILNCLASTGILIYENDEVYFWHRIFLNHFSSYSLVRKYNDDESVVNTLKKQVRWESSIIGGAYILKDPSHYINLLIDDLWLASICMYESSYIDSETEENLLGFLTDRLNSDIYEIRRRAIFYLRKLDKKKTNKIFWDLLENSKFVDVKMISLEEIALEKTEVAKQKVISLVKWDEGMGLMQSGSSSSVARALSNFDESEILKILDIWESKKDMFTSSDCVDVFISLQRNGRLNESINKSLWEFYYKHFNTEHINTHKVRDIERILKLIKDESNIPDLISTLGFEDKGHTNCFSSSINILADFNSVESVRIVLDCIIDEGCNTAIRERCSEVLLKSKARIPLDFVLEMEKVDLDRVKVNAVRLLSKFPFEEVEDKIFEYLNSNNHRLQEAAISGIYGNKLWGKVISDNRFPNGLFNNSIYTLLDSIEKFKVTEAYDLLKKFEEVGLRDSWDLRLKLRVSNAMIAIGKESEAQEIINRFYNDEGRLAIYNDFDITGLLDSIVGFNKPFATKVMLSVYQNIKSHLSKGGHYLEHCYIEAVEKIGTDPLKSILKEILSDEVDKHLKDIEYFLHVERLFRALTRIGSYDDEEYIIELLSKDVKYSWTDLKRGVECLAFFGTEISLPIVKQVARDNQNNQYTLQTCLYAYEMIIKRTGEQREISQKELLE